MDTNCWCSLQTHRLLELGPFPSRLKLRFNSKLRRKAGSGVTDTSGSQ